MKTLSKLRNIKFDFVTLAEALNDEKINAELKKARYFYRS
jgi:hypothetical protein